MQIVEIKLRKNDKLIMVMQQHKVVNPNSLTFILREIQITPAEGTEDHNKKAVQIDDSKDDGEIVTEKPFEGYVIHKSQSSPCLNEDKINQKTTESLVST